MSSHPDIYEVTGHACSGYYATFEIRSLAAVKSLFGPPCDYTLNWLFVATSGVHGTYLSIDHLERSWADEVEIGPPPHNLTVLVVQPRTCRLYFGYVPIEREDLAWLRETVGRSLQGVLASQRENLPKDVYVRE